MKRCNLIFVVGWLAFVSADTKFSGASLIKDVPITKPLIINGSDAKEELFPYQVSLRIKQNNRHFCGGSIISNRFILTAAHCTLAPNSVPENVVAVIGSVRRSSGQTINVDKITPHEKYDDLLLLNDISLIRTAEKITFSDTVQAVPLPMRDLPSDKDVQVIVSGWGQTIVGSPERPDVLKYTEASTVNIEKCIEQIKKFNPNLVKFVHNENVCAISKSAVGTCLGDSGGPLVDVTNPAGGELIGIISWTVYGCAGGYPDIYTRVFSYIDWINKHIDENKGLYD